MRASVPFARFGRLVVAGPAVVGLAVAGLAGCGSSPSAPPSASAPPGAGAGGGTSTSCRAAQLAARLGQPRPLEPGVRAVPLIYTNTSDRDCQLRGAPSVELHGPDDPNGPVFEMSARDTGGPTVTLRPGASASASIVIREDAPGRTGHAGSTGWTPTTLVSTPPGDTASLSTRWTVGGTVLREDSSTHPDEYAEPFRPLP
jgi:uncharacterized protein DUF4232